MKVSFPSPELARSQLRGLARLATFVLGSYWLDLDRYFPVGCDHPALFLLLLWRKTARFTLHFSDAHTQISSFLLVCLTKFNELRY